MYLVTIIDRRGRPRFIENCDRKAEAISLGLATLDRWKQDACGVQVCGLDGRIVFYIGNRTRFPMLKRKKRRLTPPERSKNDR